MALPNDAFWDEEEEELAALLLEHLKLAVAAGAAGNGLDEGIGIDWELVNKEVQAWARKMSLDLVKGITETSREYVTKRIAEWIESGQPLPALSKALEPMYGPVRAQMIAETEVTRAYAEGNRAAWRESGVVDGMRWMTAVDDMVCDICSQLHNAKVAIEGQPFEWVNDKGETETTEIPPAHVRCRCWIQPVVNV